MTKEELEKYLNAACPVVDAAWTAVDAAFYAAAVASAADDTVFYAAYDAYATTAYDAYATFYATKNRKKEVDFQINKILTALNSSAQTKRG